MKIEIAEPGRMTQTGSSLLRLIQNNDMPALDLLVRESIQNSLDAKQEDSQYVDVNFVTDSFDGPRLNRELEGITEALDRRFALQENRYIAIRDSHTTGLTGEMDYKKVRNNDYGNLLKLVYEICKPQEAAGAGGSWGLGKTVYFRIGIGLVIYYSRIKEKDGYASRLAASCVENENDADAMIPLWQGKSSRGIAWWGVNVGDNVTQPVTDEAYISDFLSIFGLSPYEGEETGTTIIIPYIDEKKLLHSNQVEYLDGRGEPVIPYWCRDIGSYLAIAAQRWYAPRLNNRDYNYGAYLRLRINGTGLATDDMEPGFRIIQALYNRANHVNGEEDFLTELNCEVLADKITVRKYLEDTAAGTLTAVKVKREDLKMLPPYNKPEPYMYFGCEKYDEAGHRPIICFTRQPAMIVSYETVGAWTSGVAEAGEDEYLIAVFVLHSYNQLKNAPVNMSLEEYVRKSEMADHTSWSDWSEETYNPRIITKIQNGVSRTLGKVFAPAEESRQPKAKSGLGKMFGDLLLPPDGFGRSSTSKTGTNTSNAGTGRTSSKRTAGLKVNTEKIDYVSDVMRVPFTFTTRGKGEQMNTGFDIQIDSESGHLTLSSWEEKLGLSSPCTVGDCQIDITVKGERESVFLTHDEDEKIIQDIYVSRRYTSAGTCCGLHIRTEDTQAAQINLLVNIEIKRRDVRPVFTIEKNQYVKTN